MEISPGDGDSFVRGMQVADIRKEKFPMSVRAMKRRGHAIWLVEVKRGAFHRRRYLRQGPYRKSDAIRIEQEIIREYEAFKEGRLQCSNSDSGAFTDEPLRFSEFARQYLELPDSSRSNYKNKKRDLDLYLVPFFGETELVKIDTRMVDRFRAWLRNKPTRRGKRRKPKTINNVLTTLSTIFALADEYELLERLPRLKREVVPKPEVEWLEEDTLRFVQAVPVEWRALVQTALLTGLRRAELYELRWGDIFLGHTFGYPARWKSERGLRPTRSKQPRATEDGPSRSSPSWRQFCTPTNHQTQRATRLCSRRPMADT